MISNPYQREYYEKNKAKVRAKQKEYHEKNKGKVQALKRENYNIAKYHNVNTEKLDKGFIRITEYIPVKYITWLEGEIENHDKAVIQRKKLVTILRDKETGEEVKVSRWGYALFAMNENKC